MLDNTRCTMEEATAALGREKIPFQRKTAYHLKVGQFNFYPNKGTIYIDGQSAREEKGLAAFLRMLHKARLASQHRPARPVNDPADFIVQSPDEDDYFATE